MIRQLRAAYQMVKEQQRRERQYKELVGEQLNYQIIQDLINSARYDVVVYLTLKDGTRIEMRREDAFEKAKHQMAIRRMDPEHTW